MSGLMYLIESWMPTRGPRTRSESGRIVSEVLWGLGGVGGVVDVVEVEQCLVRGTER